MRLLEKTDTIRLEIIHKNSTKCYETVEAVTETLESKGVAATVSCHFLKGAVSQLCAAVTFSVPHDDLRYIIVTPVGMIQSTEFAEYCLKALAAKKLWYDTITVKRNWRLSLR